MTERADIDRIRASVSISDIVRRVVPLKRAGSEWAARCPFHNERSASFFVNDRKRFYHCFGCGQHGDVIDFVMRTSGLDFKAAVADLSGAVAPPLHSTSAFVRRLAEATAEFAGADGRAWQPDDDARAKMARARAIWANAKPIAGTLAETYLRRRGIALAKLPPTLRFMPELHHSPSRRSWPALIGALQDGAGHVVAIQRTYLAPDGSGKAAVEGPKRTLGPMGDAAVRLGRVGRALGIAEGIETALSARQLFSLPVWATLSATRLDALALPELVEHVVIFADAGEVGMRCARKAADKYDLDGKKVMIRPPDEPYDDHNSWLQAGLGRAA